MEFGRKRANAGAVHVNGATKRYKHESESFATGIGSKSKPCMKFFSTTGCSFGESCHFLHNVPGGFNATAQMTNMPSFHPPPRNNMGPPQPFIDNSPPFSIKTKLCNRHNTSEGCKFGDKCRFAHGESELGQPCSVTQTMPPRQHNNNDGFSAAANFGALATAKIAINAALAGPIIGKGGCNSKQICRLTGVKLAIREIESDPSQRNIELEGSFDQIQEASAMVHEIIMGLGPINTLSPAAAKANVANMGRNNAKTKVCEHYLRGSCNYGEKCNFAHGDSELRNSQLG